MGSSTTERFWTGSDQEGSGVCTEMVRISSLKGDNAMSKYMCKFDVLKAVLNWCKKHNRREFYYYEINIPSQQLAGLCKSGYKRKRYIEKKGSSFKKGVNYRLRKYGLCDGVDIDDALRVVQ